MGIFITTREGMVLAVWNSVYSQRKKIFELFESILRTSHTFPNSKSRRWNRLFYGSLVCVYIYILIVSVMMTLLLNYSDAKNYIYITLFGIIVEEPSHVFVFMLYLAFNSYLLIVPSVVSFTYVYVCCQLRRMLRLCHQRLKKCRTFEETEHVFQQALDLLFLIKKTEESMSVCAFFVITFNLILSFTSLSYGLGYYVTRISISAGVVAWLFSNQISFIIICWTASNVLNGVMDLKATFQITLCNFNQSESILNMLFQKLAVLDTVSLTGWKMFNLSKGLILTAFGSILTYGLLVLQTLNYKDPQIV
ncbi:uncharacterized protein TNIN_386071 [Trichonephila inaurata madagascariensis]|uniref:Gustatory receptor n=1 Tax=Trichonephila inaurata madagascariensis TaxID=2747483 RepID=A0A8X6XDI8_9ARAC|nr:uncharacterized protein TNIN_386071 [Trichonephila inaurata madagascariensis]